MITIKKVAISPVAASEGDIIDSFNTIEDKHINAPSLNAVENYIESVRYNNFHQYEGSMRVSGNTTLQYPEGFNVGNTAILSVMWGSERDAGYIYTEYSQSTPLVCYTDTDGIKIYIQNAPAGMSYIKFKIVIMKFNTNS